MSAKNLEINLSSDNLGIENHIKKFTWTDLPIICNEIEQIIDYIKNSTNIEYFLYTYPADLEEELKGKITELECILREIKHTNLNIQLQKKQQSSFAKEKISLRKTLRKLKENEIRDMETVISLFDKAMFARWENVKSTRKPETLERFLSDITTKQMALNNLNTLVSRKLANLKKLSKSKSDQTEISGIAVVTNDSQENKIPPPPPLPTWIVSGLTNYPPLSTTEDVKGETLDELD